MLLVYQVGSLKIGEVVRYTVTYTPARDRILPSPEHLHLRIRNTSPIPLRAAFVHGPYTLCVAAYPAHFDPNRKFENPRRYGVPEHEPMLKAGGTWLCRLVVPDHIRQSAGTGAARGDFADSSVPASTGPSADGQNAPESVSWVVEVTSQVIFSASAAVGYEVMIARDEKGLSLNSVPVGVSAGGGKSHAQVPQPGKIGDYQQSAGGRKEGPGHGHHAAQPKGVFSKAITLKVEDTASLWNTPQLPGWRDWDYGRTKGEGEEEAVHSVTDNAPPAGATAGPEAGTSQSQTKRRKPKKVHLVVLTHGLHSNLGADMLFMKESIDATVRQAKVDAKARRAREKQEREEKKNSEKGTQPESPESSAAAPSTDDNKEKVEGVEEAKEAKTIPIEEEEEYDDEEVIVRGFSGNATRTERGIKFLGKRLARFVLSMTYPDQPYLPALKKATGSISLPFRGEESKDEPSGAASHKNSTIHKGRRHEEDRPFQITSISFIGHSLGGLVQTYAIAYIQKHSPQFFDIIRPINFIALASPMLGLSNENPLYVKFALDFGLVGRTGQDLGLTWRAPTIARSGWGAIVGTLGETAHKKVIGESQPESKPLLRILPTGPAHVALKKFRNRTLYSNVVNDGIVPLRTSCLLFLDWQGLDRVEKARREAGLVETVVGFGWAELTGANTTARKEPWTPTEETDAGEAAGAATEQSGTSSPQVAGEHGDSREVPQPPSNATVEDDRQSLSLARAGPVGAGGQSQNNSQTNNDFPFSGFFNFFKSNGDSKAQAQQQQQQQATQDQKATSTSGRHSPRQSKIYQRSQTLRFDDNTAASSPASGSGESPTSSKSRVTAGHESSEDHENGSGGGSGNGASVAPPRTTFFEAAGDLLNPRLAPVDFLIDPSRRPRTIFHDRVYHPSDIPPPPLKKRTMSSRSLRHKGSSKGDKSAANGAGSMPTVTSPTDNANSASSSPYLGPNPGIPHQDSTATTTTSSSVRDYYEPSQDPRLGEGQGQEEMVVDSGSMKVEEKIARAYHRGLSWRKVLVKLEPDAHNNIIVRRTFSNAHGWPVIRHLCDAHFSDAAAARTRDALETGAERAKDTTRAPDRAGAETGTQADADGYDEARDAVPDMRSPPSTLRKDGSSSNGSGSGGLAAHSAANAAAHHHHHQQLPGLSSSNPSSPSDHDRPDSGAWSDRDFADSGDESEFDGDLAYGGQLGHQNHGPGADAREGDKKSRKAKKSKKAKGSGSRSGSGSGKESWNWTEKIVGKGAGRKTSPHANPNSSPNLNSAHAGPATTATSMVTAMATPTPTTRTSSRSPQPADTPPSPQSSLLRIPAPQSESPNGSPRAVAKEAGAQA